MTVSDLMQVALTLVIVWLIVGIRQSLGLPSASFQVKRAAERATQAVKTKQSKADDPSNLVPLDSMPPEDALDALSKHYGVKQ